MSRVKYVKSKEKKLFLILLLLIIGVGYAILNTSLTINGTSKITNSTWNIYFDHLNVTNGSVLIDGNDSTQHVAAINPSDNTKISYSVFLDKPGDFYEFSVDVVNSGSIDGMIDVVSSNVMINNQIVSTLPNYLNYTVKYDTGGDLVKNQILRSNTSQKIIVRVEFKRDINVSDLPNELKNVSLDFSIDYVQADSNAIMVLPVKICTYDGELVQGAEFVDGQYTYHYMQRGSATLDESFNVVDYPWVDIDTDGWGVILTDKDSTSEVNTKLCSSINGKPIVAMSEMFNNSKSTTIDLSSFDTSNVVTMEDMFAYSKFTALDVTNFDTKNVTDMSGMFFETSVTSLDVSNFDTSSLNKMDVMFYQSTSLESLKLGHFDASNVTDMTGVFGYTGLKSLNLKGFDMSGAVILSQTFGGLHELESLDLSTINTNNVEDMSYMFFDSTGLKNINFGNMNTDKVENMSNMFYNTSSLESVDISKFNVNNVTDVTSMFRSSGVKSIIFGNSFNTQHVTSMEQMFYGTKRLESIDISKFNTSLVNDMTEMFSYSGIQSINFGENLDTSKVRLMKSMFYKTTNLEEIDFSHISFDSVENMNSMFQYSGVSSIDFGNNNINKVTDIAFMFNDAPNLTVLDMSGFDTSLVTRKSYMFYRSNMTTVYVKNNDEVTRLSSGTSKPNTLNILVKQ